MKKPDIPKLSGPWRWAALLMGLFILVNMVTHFVPLSIYVPILILVIAIGAGYYLYYSIKQQCTGYSWLMAIVAVLLIALCIVLSIMSKKYGLDY